MPKAKKESAKKAKLDSTWMDSLRMLGASIGIPAFFVLSFIFIVEYVSEGKITPHTQIGTVKVGGMTFEQAEDVLEARGRAVVDAGITLKYNDQQIHVSAQLADPANSEIALSLMNVNTAETIKRIEEKESALNPAVRAARFIAGASYAPTIAVDVNRLREQLATELRPLESPAQDASVSFVGDTLAIVAEKSGKTFPYDEMINEIVNQYQHLAPPSLAIALQTDRPGIIQSEVKDLVPEVTKIVAAAPYQLTYGDKTWEITKEKTQTLAGFFRKEDAGTNEVAAGFAPEAFQEFVTPITAEINREPSPAKFEITGGKVTQFEPQQNGLSLNIPKTIASINTLVSTGGTTDLPLVVDETEPDVTTADANTMGIKELVATGKTSFAGSPKNRRHNIGVAAEKLNGMLIAPGEEFSLVKALSPIEKSNGYLPELVIKGNKTIPEVGGGLCQVGTTFFRLVLESGLPVLERKNHSYRVSYYEPPVGMDATIYDPKPDFRFTNDYGTHLLLQARIEGDNLIFDFYGSKDGRKAVSTAPRVFNVTKPGPTKIIETTDLAPGQRKCIEKAHNGADAEFTYTVTYGDGRVESEVFKSHYRPWQEVCLVGVAEKAPETPDTQIENAPDTNAIQN
ncbi:MAG: VanW family protein [Patescibacteria group bacterium]|jgi:vancomycin resistance protein YoaR